MKLNKTIKKKRCSPYAEDVKINEKSCLSGTVMQKIKKSYNKKNPSRRITHRNPNKIWKELTSLKPKCETELCWLNEIENKQTREEIVKEFYAPNKPMEWKENPNEWLSNYDILDVINQYEKIHKNFKFFGPTPINFNSPDMNYKDKCVWEELCNFNLENHINNGINKMGVVFNLSKQGESGSHWVSLFIDIKNKMIFYFDSNGDSCPNEIKELINTVKNQGLKKKIIFKEIYNTFEHQQSNTECGMYSLYFIITMLTEKINNKKKSMRTIIHHFTKNRIPDDLVFKHRNLYFNE